MNAANLIYQGSLFCCILDKYSSTILSHHDAGILQMFIENESIMRRRRNFFVILAVYIYETMNISPVRWLSLHLCSGHATATGDSDTAHQGAPAHAYSCCRR